MGCAYAQVGGGLIMIERDDFPIDQATTLAPGRALTVRSGERLGRQGPQV